MRGIIVGDFVRRLVARTLAQQLGPAVESATALFQFALSTKAGSECIAHVAQALTDMDDHATLLSVDGIGAFDLVSRGAMMSGLLEVKGGASALPFVRQFYGSPSTYLWDDDNGVTHEIAQGEGGEQGDALMPLLFSFGLHRSLCAVSDRLLPTERLLAFLDDLHVICSPERVPRLSCSPRRVVGSFSNSDTSREDPSMEPSRGANRCGRDDRSCTHGRSDCVEG